MKSARAALVLAVLLGSQAQAAVMSYSFQGAVNEWDVSLQSSYPTGTAFSGVFHIDYDVAPSNTDPSFHDYYGAYSGSVTVGGNTISFADGYAYVYNNPNGPYSQVTLLGGNAWGSGGSISETQPPAGYGIEGFQIMSFYQGIIPASTSIHDILTGIPLEYASVYLNYDQDTGAWGTITQFKALGQPVPEPASILLTALGLAAVAAARGARKAPL